MLGQNSPLYTRENEQYATYDPGEPPRVRRKLPLAAAASAASKCAHPGSTATWLIETSKANMIKQPSNRHAYLTGILGLCLGLALQADAQQRGGGGFGGGGFGGGSQRQHQLQQQHWQHHRAEYPNNTTIGDAYFSIDPETHRVVYIADEATAKYIGQVLTNLDRPKPQVLIKVVFLEVTHNDASDIGIEGSFSKNIGNSSDQQFRDQLLRW